MVNIVRFFSPIILGLVINFPLWATSIEINLADLSLSSREKKVLVAKLQGKMIQVRGFWYPLSPNEGILTTQPNLRSCCLKNVDQMESKIFIRNPASFPSYKAITLEGIFKIESRDVEGQWIDCYILEHPKQVIHSSSISILGIILSIGVILTLFIFCFIRKINFKRGVALQLYNGNTAIQD